MPIEPFIRQAEPWHFWALCSVLALAGLWSLLKFVRSTHHSRLLTDLPTANIRSAPQGYVQLHGRSRMMAGEPVIAPLSGKPCVWYRFVVEQNARDPEHDHWLGGWESVEHGVSDAIFALEDGTGRCIVDPDGAKVTPSTNLVWRGREPRPGFSPKVSNRWNLLFGSGPYRYTESRIHEDDWLGAVGYFETLGSGPVSGPDEEVRRLLSAWKKDRAALLCRFDENRDGTVDLQEWDAAQRVAEEVVADEAGKRADDEVIHVLKNPGQGRPFFLFAAEPTAMVARYRRMALFGGVLFLFFAMALAWAVYIRLNPQKTSAFPNGSGITTARVILR